MSKRIILFASHEVQALDITGPSSVFSAANQFMSDDPAYRIEIVSPAGGLIETVSGVSIQSKSASQVESKAVDTFLVAGHTKPGTEALAADHAACYWAMDVIKHARRWGSVCSGAFILAEWGLLENRRAATHWSVTDELATRYPNTEVDPNSLYVIDESIWTSAGVTSGIDMALAMVESDFGADLAARIAKHLVVYLRRPGHQSQFSIALKTQCAAASPYQELQDWIAANLEADLSVENLAVKAGQSQRSFQRRFAKEMGRTPAAYVEDVRMERAKTLISSGAALQVIASQIGYSSAAQFTIAFRRRYGIAPSVWQTMHQG